MRKKDGLRWVSGEATPHRVYVTRVINLGTHDEWRTMRDTMTKEQILDAIDHPLKGQWTSHGKAFAECVFGRALPDDVLISYA